jgi:hypothetical protein
MREGELDAQVIDVECGGSTPLSVTRLDASADVRAGRRAGPSKAASSRRTPYRSLTASLSGKINTAAFSECDEQSNSSRDLPAAEAKAE